MTGAAWDGAVVRLFGVVNPTHRQNKKKKSVRKKKANARRETGKNMG